MNTKLKQWFVYLAIVAMTAAFLISLAWKHRSDLEQIKTSYLAEQNAEIERSVKNIETTFNDFYQGIRTMSLLPGVRSIDRYAKNFNPDSKAAMQQIYNNTFLNVTLSEVYILPASMEPDRIDPLTHKLEEPILTFDEFIVNKSDVDQSKKEEEKQEFEETEIFEYRLMKKQLAYLSEKFPVNTGIVGLAVPAISGEEVITCDNSEFTTKELQSKNDEPRKGIVLTVPRYDMSGKFAGGVSGVVRTNVLKKLFPANYYGLVNKSYGWQVIEAPIAEWSESASWFNEGKSNPNLIVSQVRDLKIVDATPWQLWIAKSDQDFYGRHDVKQANTIFYAGMTVSLLLGGILIFGAWSAFTNQERLVRKVEEKTAALSERNDQMALILNNAEEGFLTLNLDGTMAEERSAIVDTWFGTPSSGMKFWDYISAGQSQATLLRMGWDQLVEGVFSFEMSADQMPKMVTRDKLTLSLKFKAVNDLDHKLFKVLVMITDVTALIEAAKREVQQRELLAVFQKFSTDRSGFLQFFHDAKEIIQRIYHRNAQGNRDVDFREVHTLKGNASQFGMISVAEVCHQIETELSEAGRPLVNEERLQLKLAWEEASESLKDFIKDENVNQLVVGQTEYQRLLKLLRATRGAEHFAEQLESWSLESTVVPFRRLGEQVQALTQRLGKGDIEVVILDHGVRLDAEYLREFWMNTTHLVRNTADHAIESPEERLKLGKGKPKITFESKLQGPNVVLTFTDDGCGIRWSKISDIAKRKGLPSASKKDLVMALFADGVSTSDEVSAISGRGVGMSALLSSVTSLGGNIDIASEIGKGTCISITLPCKAAETVKVA